MINTDLCLYELLREPEYEPVHVPIRYKWDVSKFAPVWKKDKDIQKAASMIAQHCMGTYRSQSVLIAMLTKNRWSFSYQLWFNRRSYFMNFDIYIHSDGSWDIFNQKQLRRASKRCPLKERRKIADLELNRVRELFRTPLKKILSGEIFV